MSLFTEQSFDGCVPKFYCWAHVLPSGSSKEELWCLPSPPRGSWNPSSSPSWPLLAQFSPIKPSSSPLPHWSLWGRKRQASDHLLSWQLHPLLFPLIFSTSVPCLVLPFSPKLIVMFQIWAFFTTFFLSWSRSLLPPPFLKQNGDQRWNNFCCFWLNSHNLFNSKWEENLGTTLRRWNLPVDIFGHDNNRQMWGLARWGLKSAITNHHLFIIIGDGLEPITNPSPITITIACLPTTITINMVHDSCTTSQPFSRCHFIYHHHQHQHHCQQHCSHSTCRRVTRRMFASNEGRKRSKRRGEEAIKIVFILSWKWDLKLGETGEDVLGTGKSLRSVWGLIGIAAWGLGWITVCGGGRNNGKIGEIHGRTEMISRGGGGLRGGESKFSAGQQQWTCS